VGGGGESGFIGAFMERQQARNGYINYNTQKPLVTKKARQEVVEQVPGYQTERPVVQAPTQQQFQWRRLSDQPAKASQKLVSSHVHVLSKAQTPLKPRPSLFSSQEAAKPFTRAARHRNNDSRRQIQDSLDRIQNSVKKQSGIAAVRYDAKMSVLPDRRLESSGLNLVSSIHLSQFQEEQEEQFAQSLGPFTVLENPFLQPLANSL